MASIDVHEGDVDSTFGVSEIKLLLGVIGSFLCAIGFSKAFLTLVVKKFSSDKFAKAIANSLVLLALMSIFILVSGNENQGIETTYLIYAQMGILSLIAVDSLIWILRLISKNK